LLEDELMLKNYITNNGEKELPIVYFFNSVINGQGHRGQKKLPAEEIKRTHGSTTLLRLLKK